MRRTAFLLIACAPIGSLLADDAALDTLISQYSDAVVANAGAGFDQTTALAWIERFSVAVPEAENPHLVQSGLHSIMSLYCWLQRWDEALAVCDQAYAQAPTDEVRVRRLLDRFAIVEARTGGVPRQQGPDSGARLAPTNELPQNLLLIQQLLRRMIAADEVAMLPPDVLHRFFWSAEMAGKIALESGNTEAAIEIMDAAMRLIGTEETFPSALVKAARFQNMRARAAAAALGAGMPDRALNLVQAGPAVRMTAHEIRLAHRMACELAVPASLSDLHEFVLRAPLPKQPSHDVLALYAEHAREVLRAANRTAEGSPNVPPSMKVVEGVGVGEVIALLEHAVVETEDHMRRTGVDHLDPQTRWTTQTLRTSKDYLRGLYLLSGDPEGASHYPRIP